MRTVNFLFALSLLISSADAIGASEQPASNREVIEIGFDGLSE